MSDPQVLNPSPPELPEFPDFEVLTQKVNTTTTNVENKTLPKKDDDKTKPSNKRKRADDEKVEENMLYRLSEKDKYYNLLVWTPGIESTGYIDLKVHKNQQKVLVEAVDLSVDLKLIDPTEKVVKKNFEFHNDWSTVVEFPERISVKNVEVQIRNDWTKVTFTKKEEKFQEGDWMDMPFTATVDRDCGGFY